MGFIQTSNDAAYRQQQRDADEKWAKEQKQDDEMRRAEADKKAADEIEARYRHDNNGKSPP